MTTMTPADRDRLDNICDTFHALAALGPEAKVLVNRLDDLHSATLAATEDRVLRRCGAVLLEHAANLFEDIYARVREGSVVERGEARAFLFSELPQ